jgi:Bacterial protein of unknown function (Gcw_chp)
MKPVIRKFQTLMVCAALMCVAKLSARADEAAGKPDAGHPPADTAPAAAPAPVKDWSVTVAADWFSEYIFRGVDLLGNDPVFVPSVVAKWKGLTAYYYGYYGDSDFRNNKWYEETDLGADWTQTVLDGKLALTAGGLYYVYPDGISGKDTWELYGKATWSNYVNPYIGINWDIDEFHGGYAVAGISHTYDLTKPLKLPDGMALSIVPSAQLGIDLGYNSRRTGANVNWNDVLLGVNVPFNITPQFCIHAALQVSIALDSLNDIGQHNELIGNVGASYSF